MNYKKIECDEYNIHLIKNKKFHTIDFQVCFTENVTLEKLTSRNVLVEMLTYATKMYDTKKKLVERSQELYSISPRASSIRYGKLLSTKFTISLSDSIYISQHNIIDNILLLKEIILNPLVINGGFKKEIFKIIQRELEYESLTTKEEPRLYANLSLVKMLDEGKDEIISGFCNVDILRQMTEKTLYKDYLSFLEESKIDIYISGNIQNEKEIIKTIKDNFIFNNKVLKLNNKFIVHRERRKETLFKEETKKYQQSKLAMGLKIYDITEDESKYVLTVLNNLLGGGSNSYLMRYVREENNLCYYVGSFFNRLDNIIIINSGINKDKFEQVISLIKEILKTITEGKFTRKDLSRAITESVVQIRSIEESNRNILDYYYGLSVFDTDILKVRLEKIKGVSKEDIVNLAKKMNIDSIFFLKGDL